MGGYDDDEVRTAVRAALDRPQAEVERWEPGAVGHVGDNMTTERLDRVVGTLTDGTRWSLVAKVLRPASASPLWSLIPDFAQAEVLRQLDWRDEPRAYACGLADAMPNGVRMPHLAHVEDGDERIVLWLEDVADRATWDAATYRRAAEGLGRLAGRFPEGRVTGELGLRRRLLGEYFGGRVVHAVIPSLADDATWADPLAAAATASDPDLRADLDRLASDAAALVARVDSTPLALGHGDATPANILDDGCDLVLLDWSFGSAMPVGMDLAQLVAGAVDGRTVGDLAVVAEADALVVDAYCAGLADEGAPVERGDVELAYLVTLAVRSALSCLDVSHAADLAESERAALVEQRTWLARLALDRLAAISPTRR